MNENHRGISEERSSEPAAATLTLAKRRAPLLLFLFGVWALVVCWRLFDIMVVNRGQFLQQMTASSWRQDTIPAIRGRILDKAGTPLAWSTRHFKLQWRRPASAEVSSQYRQIASALDAITVGDDGPDFGRHGVITLLPDIEPSQFASASALAETLPEVKISSYFTRHHYPDPRIKRRLGKVALRGGMEIGVSGTELEHDSLLRGRPGLFRVLHGPDGKRLSDTWHQIRPVRPGYDVYLQLRVYDAP